MAAEEKEVMEEKEETVAVEEEVVEEEEEYEEDEVEEENVEVVEEEVGAKVIDSGSRDGVCSIGYLMFVFQLQHNKQIFSLLLPPPSHHPPPLLPLSFLSHLVGNVWVCAVVYKSFDS